MKLSELYIQLKRLGIPENRYYLHGLYGSSNDEDKLALTIKQGKYTTEFEIYYKEKGEKKVLRVFTAEDEACEYMFKKLKDNKEIEDKYSN